MHVTAPLKMIKSCSENNAIFVQASSHAVFDGTKESPYTEEDRPNPLNVYGISKYASEILTTNICQKLYIIRFPTLYGNRRNKSKGFVDKMIEKIMSGKEFRVADDKIDSVSYVKDVSNSLLNIFAK